MTTTENPAIGKDVEANGIRTNYLEAGSGGPDRRASSTARARASRPTRTGAACCRCSASTSACVAPDMVGFGYSERPEKPDYSLDTWADQTLGVMDALGIEKAHLVGNSFGGGIALRLATKHPDRVDKMVLMGSMGVPFEITEGLDNVWGYEGTLEHMKTVMGYFAYDKSLTSGDLAQARFEGATQPGFQESFSSMFPAPRQRWVESMTVPDDEIRALPHRTLIVHGREDQVIPLETSLQAAAAARQRRPVGVLPLRALVDDRAPRRLQPAGPRLLPRRAREGQGRHDGSKTRTRRPRTTRSRAATPSCCAASTRSWSSPGRSRTAWWPCTAAATCSARSTPGTGTRRSSVGAASCLRPDDYMAPHPPRPRRAPVAGHGALAGDGELHGQGDLADRRPGRHAALRPARPGHLQPAQPHPGQLPGGHRDGVRREVPRRGQGVPGVLRRRVDLAGRLPRGADDRQRAEACRTCSSSRTTSTPTRRRCG